jgi:WXG100 family type VII secretion target
MAEYKVDSERLAASASVIKGQGLAILEALGKVTAEIETANGFWQGTANSNFVGLMDGWKATATRVQQQLDETMVRLDQAARDYGSTESSNAGKFNGAS